MSVFDKIVDYCWGQALDIPKNAKDFIWILSIIAGIVVGIYTFWKTGNPNVLAIFVIGVIGAGIAHATISGLYCLFTGRMGGAMWCLGSMALLVIGMYVIYKICIAIFG